MKIHKYQFAGLSLLISVLMFTSPSVYAVKRLKTYGLPVLPAYKKNDGAYLYFAVSSPSCTDAYNKVVIDGAIPVLISSSWWTISWCERRWDNSNNRLGRFNDRLRIYGPRTFSPGTHKFQLQGRSRNALDSSEALTKIIKFKKTFAPGEFWVLWTQFSPKGNFSYGLIKLGVCGRVKQFEVPPKSDRQDYNRYRILSGITRDIKAFRWRDGTRWKDLSYCK